MAIKTRQAAISERRQFWQKHIENCQKSSITQREYCLQNNLKEHRMWYWKKRLKKVSPQPPVSLVQLQFPNEPRPRLTENSSSTLRLIIGDRFRIDVERDFDPVALQQLIYALSRF